MWQFPELLVSECKHWQILRLYVKRLKITDGFLDELDAINALHLVVNDDQSYCVDLILFILRFYGLEDCSATAEEARELF